MSPVILPLLDLPALDRTPEGKLPSKSDFLRLLWGYVDGNFVGFRGMNNSTLQCILCLNLLHRNSEPLLQDCQGSEYLSRREWLFGAAGTMLAGKAEGEVGGAEYPHEAGQRYHESHEGGEGKV